jgi:hypothetical protein
MSKATTLKSIIGLLGKTEKSFIDKLQRPTVEKFYERSIPMSMEKVNKIRMNNLDKSFKSNPKFPVRTYGKKPTVSKKGTVGGDYTGVYNPYTQEDFLATLQGYNDDFERNVRRGLNVARPVTRSILGASAPVGYGIGSFYNMINNMRNN